MTFSSNSAPELSICIPLFNKKPYLERCFRHIASQDIGNYEVVVFDNASTDGPQDLLEAWKQKLPLRVFHMPVTLSIHESWAVCLGLGCGAIRQLHSADDYLAEGALSGILNYLRQYPSVDYVIGRSINIMDDGSPITNPEAARYCAQLENWRRQIHPDMTVADKARFLAQMAPGQNFFGDINPVFMRSHCVDALRRAARTTAPLFHTVPDLEIYLKLFAEFNGAYLPQNTLYCTLNESSTYERARKAPELWRISYEIPAWTALPFLLMHPLFRSINQAMPYWIWPRRLLSQLKTMLRFWWHHIRHPNTTR